MKKSQIVALLSTTALILGTSLNPASSMDLSNSTNLSGSGSAPKSPLPTPFLALRGGLARKQQVITTHQALQKLAKEGDDDAKIALLTPDPEQAILKYNDILKEEALRKSMGTDALTKSETKIIKIARKKAGDSEEGLEQFASQLETGTLGVNIKLPEKHQKIIDEYEEVQRHKPEKLLGALFDTANEIERLLELANEKSKAIGQSEKIPVNSTKFNELRENAGLSALQTHTNSPTVNVGINELKELQHSTTRSLMTILDNPTVKLTAAEKLNAYKILFDVSDHDERLKEFQNLIQYFLELGEWKGVPLKNAFDLYKYLHTKKEHLINKMKEEKNENPNSDDNDKLNMIVYFMSELDGKDYMESAKKEYDTWVIQEERLEKLKALGPVWNEILDSGMIKKYAYSPKDPYIVDHTAIPLITLLNKNITAVCKKALPSIIASWANLVPYTPHNVIKAIYYVMVRENFETQPIDIKFPDTSTNVTGRPGAISNFLQKIKDAAKNEEFKPKSFKDDDKRLQNSLDSVVGGSGQSGEWNKYPPNNLRKFNPSVIETSAVELKKTFVLNMDNHQSFFPNYSTKKQPVLPPKRETPIKRAANNMTKEFETRINVELEKIFNGKPNLPSSAMFRQIFYDKVFKSSQENIDNIPDVLALMNKNEELDLYKPKEESASDSTDKTITTQQTIDEPMKRGGPPMQRGGLPPVPRGGLPPVPRGGPPMLMPRGGSENPPQSQKPTVSVETLSPEDTNLIENKLAQVIGAEPNWGRGAKELTKKLFIKQVFTITGSSEDKILETLKEMDSAGDLDRFKPVVPQPQSSLLPSTEIFKKPPPPKNRSASSTNENK